MKKKHYGTIPEDLNGQIIRTQPNVKHLDTAMKGLPLFCMALAAAAGASVAQPQSFPLVHVQPHYADSMLRKNDCRPFVIDIDDVFLHGKSPLVSGQTRIPITYSVIISTSTGSHVHLVTVMV